MREIDFKIAPEDVDNDIILKEVAAKSAKIPVRDIIDFRIIRRSLDARYRPPVYLLRAQLTTDEVLPPAPVELDKLHDVKEANQAIVLFEKLMEK